MSWTLPSNQFIALRDCMILIASAYRDDTKDLQKRNTLSTTINAGDGGSVGCVAGRFRIYVTQDLSLSPQERSLMKGFMYLGWAGFTALLIEGTGTQVQHCII